MGTILFYIISGQRKLAVCGFVWLNCITLCGVAVILSTLCRWLWTLRLKPVRFTWSTMNPTWRIQWATPEWWWVLFFLSPHYLQQHLNAPLQTVLNNQPHNGPLPAGYHSECAGCLLLSPPLFQLVADYRGIFHHYSNNEQGPVHLCPSINLSKMDIRLLQLLALGKLSFYFCSSDPPRLWVLLCFVWRTQLCQ